MKKLPLLLLLALVLLLASAFFLFTRTKVRTENAQTKNNLVEKTQSFSVSGNIDKLLNKNKSLKCTYSYNTGEQTLNGTLYTSGKMFRSEFEMPMENNDTAFSYSLSDGKDMYTWTDGNNQGMKINLEESQDMAKDYQDSPDSENHKQASDQLNNEYEYKCQNWKVNPEKFKVPANIEFSDLTETMKQVQETTCGICDQLPDSAKQACLDNCQ